MDIEITTLRIQRSSSIPQHQFSASSITILDFTTRAIQPVDDEGEIKMQMFLPNAASNEAKLTFISAFISIPFQKPCHHRRNPSKLTIAKKPSRYRNPLTHHSSSLLFAPLLVAVPPSPASSLRFSSSFPFQFNRVTLISALYTELNEYFFFDSSPIHATCTNSRAFSFDSSPLLISSSRVFTFDSSSLISCSPLPFITALTNVKETVCSLATSSLLYCEASRFPMRQSIDP
ncbi:uncharacterized protein LOC110263749 [Arachis ipaensis]|uniref:uncharacterized protein LOC110263749 n=1 Tax=Arachis ipaensis TaxID=130454 RepID=UPI000A2B3639|nr:uncharacterized protein LOC110263749 [Arachis ipaensis]